MKKRAQQEAKAGADTSLALESAILDLLARRGEGKTICPSEAARQVDPALWKTLMGPARSAALRLVVQGQIVMTQKGAVVDPSTAKGAIRLRRV